MPYNWLDEVLEGTAEYESPRNYYYWSALAALSAVCKRNIFLNQFRFYLYPNIYVFLVGPSGIRKGPPVNFAKRLVEAISNTHIIAGRSSIQGIVKELGTSRTQENGPILNEASGFICAGEFAASLVEDPAALNTLTDLYDAHYHDKYKVNLVGREGDLLDRPYVVLLGASNQVHLREIIQTKDIEGGFIARTFIINASKKNTSNSLVKPPKTVLNEGRIIEYLRQVSQIRNGEFHYVDGADDLYDEWYHKQEDVEVDDPTGTRARITTSVLKVAMLISLTKGLDLTIKPDDINEALVACNELIADMNTVFMPGKGSETELGKKVSIVLTDLMNAKDYTLSRQQLMTRHWGYLDAFSIDQVVETLLQPGMIKVIKNGNKAAYTYYKLTTEGVNAILQLEGSIQKERGVVTKEGEGES